MFYGLTNGLPGNLIHKDIISPAGNKDFFAQHNESRKIFLKLFLLYFI